MDCVRLYLGDFNEILHPSGRFNCASFSESMIAFLRFINDAKLIEIPLQGRFFTWQNRLSKSKIDRCFVSSSVLEKWPNLRLQALSRSFSDHVPILLSSVARFDWGLKPFRSLNVWWDHPDFPSFLNNCWLSLRENSALVIKLRELRKLISSWNRHIFGDLNSKVTAVNQQIAALEQSADYRDLTDDDYTALSAYNSELLGLSKQLEVTCPSDIKSKIREYYRSLYKEGSHVSFSLNSLPFKVLSNAHSEGLTSVITLEELSLVVMHCDDKKAPGPDGFNMFFYKRAWQILKGDIFRLFQIFQVTGSFPSGLNTAFLILIPKFKGAVNIKDYRPISLINSIFKFLSKILAKRLAPLLPSIISENQFGFIKGRNIHECHSIASEVIHLCSRRKDSTFIVKLDFQKAFDFVSWRFLLETMRMMNFNSSWINWITNLLNSSQMSVMINGSPSDNFVMEKGVRQGDPLSPMLFVIAAEGFKAIIEKAKSLGLFTGIQIDGFRKSLSLLQFADDTLLFLPNDLEMVKNLLRVLRCFAIVSGLRINFQKSSIIGLNVPKEDITSAASILNCKIETLSFTYLGLPISRRNLAVSQFNPIIQNFNSHLALWKGNLLSPAGRLIMIKSVMCSLPVYSMCSFVIPRSVISSMESFLRNFLWTGSGSSRGICKVAWKDICLSTCLGGFNVNRVSSNINSRNDLVDPRNRNLLSHWRGVRKLCVYNENIWSMFTSNISFRMGNGRDIIFWRDLWLPNQVVPLSSEFHNLFVLVRNSTAAVYDYAYVDDQLGWHFNWKRRLRLGEQDSLRQLLVQLQQVKPSSQRDSVFWIGNVSYSAASLVRLMTVSDHEKDQFLFLMWKHKIPPRIQFFTWLLHKGRISSNEFMVQRRVLPDEQIFCSLCAEIESANHIIIYCPIAWRFWIDFLGKIGVKAWTIPKDVSSFYFQWMNLENPKYKNL
ncbi:uncharacterized protein LOC126668597 [Mercurialis annua]|uniref:uncharacterized protein LOC126668597 n=1 Tax=Mercurialis annua TaxID=3986 RepID=UPI00215F33A0|nr:uncharacterized protein LOC126668597 [Mercurialis annua]